MTVRTETQAGGKPRGTARLKMLAVSATAVSALALTHHDILAALATLATLTVTGLVLRARWARYGGGSRLAAWRRRRHQGPASWAELRRRAFASRDAIPICTVTRGRTR